MNAKFYSDVIHGLQSQPKSLPSKYFYDRKGSKLFVEIMNLPEYYLTRSELEIFREKTQQLIHGLSLEKNNYFELIELGAGNGLKSLELVKELNEQKYAFEYVPIDISKKALDLLQDRFSHSVPGVRVNAKKGDYFQILDELKKNSHPKVILFLGSTLGNMTDERAGRFIYRLGENLKPGDQLLLGLDLIKEKEIVLPAYDDELGVTREFNLNLLERINRELDANFNLKQFEHVPEYSEQEGIARSYLKSKTRQIVKIGSEEILFDKDEKVHVEISRKYNDEVLKNIISETDFVIHDKIYDSKKYFANYILVRK